MRSATLNLLKQLQNAPLLDRMGEPNALPNRMVASWCEALDLCSSEPWNALQLMMKNRHVDVVNRLNWDRFQNWNTVCAELRPEIGKIAAACEARLVGRHKWTTDLQGSISWDILCILLEREFEDVTQPAFYLPTLFPIYLAGHFPCGWTGPKLDTDWSSGSAPLPTGEVLIY